MRIQQSNNPTCTGGVVTWHGLLSCYATLTGPQWGLNTATITRWMDLGVEQSHDQPSPPGIQTDSPRQCFANQVWTVQRTTDLRLRQERDIVRNSMARLEVKSFVTKCLKPLGSIIGWRWRKKQSRPPSSKFLEFFNHLQASGSYGIWFWIFQN